MIFYPIDDIFFFIDENEKVSTSHFSGLKIVHLDLKGAPPKLSYYAEFFPFLKKLGASGVLIEYEDMFPYLSIDASANNAYTRGEIETILKLANESSLEVIPLIQTFGHLEFLLKLQKYKHLRENIKYPQVSFLKNYILYKTNFNLLTIANATYLFS